MYKATDPIKQREHYLGWENDEDNDNGKMELDREDIKTLCYEDVTLLMLPNPEGKRDLLAMEVTLKYTKGWKKKLNPLVFARNHVCDALLTFSAGKRTSLLRLILLFLMRSY